LFCGMLSGSEWGPNIAPWCKGRGKPADLGQCFVCIDPEVFGGGFPDRMSSFMHTMRNLPPVDPSKPVLAPGDPEKAMEAAYRRDGIALHKNLIAALQVVGEKAAVAPLVMRTK